MPWRAPCARDRAAAIMSTGYNDRASLARLTSAADAKELHISKVDLTFLNLPLVRPERWAWGQRSSYTVGLLELRTDAGITGVGEINACMGPAPDVLRAITAQMAPSFIGDTPLAPQRLLSRVMGAGWYPFHRTAALVLGGLEMACWDVMGKYLNQPVHCLFGGAIKTSFPSMYYVQTQVDLDVMLQNATDAVERGFRTIYFKVGIDEERDVALVRRMRETLGSGPRIRIDANEAWSAGTAVRILRMIQSYDIEYVEQPVSMFDIDGMAHVRRASGVAVGANQTSWGSHAILEIIRKNAADVIMSDCHQEGGLIPMKKILSLCEIAGLPFVNHAFNATTMTLMAHLHVMATSPSTLLAVQGHPDFLEDDYVTEPLDYTGGTIELNHGPGLGLEIDPDKVARYQAKFDEEGMASIYPTSYEGPIISVPAY
jgi:L-alanine-DL-glutamate epimerase-like enolase superfamily enzyme